jgi:hypothetical protein
MSDKDPAALIDIFTVTFALLIGIVCFCGAVWLAVQIMMDLCRWSVQ